MPSRKYTIETMPTKKAPRNEKERLPKKSSLESSAAAAKRDPAVTVPSPLPKKGSNNRTAPSSSLRNERYASHITKDSSNPMLNTEAIGVGTTAPIPSKQVVTRLWSKGAVVKQISSVQDESIKKLPPHHSMGMGLHKSPPELNAAAVILKSSSTNSVAAAASTLIYQKNYVDGNSGGKGGRSRC